MKFHIKQLREYADSPLTPLRALRMLAPAEERTLALVAQLGMACASWRAVACSAWWASWAPPTARARWLMAATRGAPVFDEATVGLWFHRGKNVSDGCWKAKSWLNASATRLNAIPTRLNADQAPAYRDPYPSRTFSFTPRASSKEPRSLRLPPSTHGSRRRATNAIFRSLWRDSKFARTGLLATRKARISAGEELTRAPPSSLAGVRGVARQLWPCGLLASARIGRAPRRPSSPGLLPFLLSRSQHPSCPFPLLCVFTSLPIRSALRSHPAGRPTARRGSWKKGLLGPKGERIVAYSREVDRLPRDEAADGRCRHCGYDG